MDQLHPHQTQTILDSIAEGVFTVDLNWRITFFNQAAEKITGVSRSDAVGCFCRDILRSSACTQNCWLKQTIGTGRRVTHAAAALVNSQGARIPLRISTALLLDERDRVVGGVETFRDVSVVEDLREDLANIIEQVMAARPMDQRQGAHLPGNVSPRFSGKELPAARITGTPVGAFDDVERGFLYACLEQNNWSRKLTAAQLEMHPTTLWRKIKRLKIETPRIDGRSNRIDGRSKKPYG